MARHAIDKRGAVRLSTFGLALVVTFFVTAVPAVSSSAGGTAPAAAKPVIGKPVTVPAKPLAGKRFTVSFKVTRSDTGARLTRGRMICDPSIVGKVLRHQESFKRGVARLSFVIPADANGKVLKVKVTIKSGKRSGTKVARFRVASAAAPSLSIGDVSAMEGNSGTTTWAFPVTLSVAASQPVTVSYATSDGSATAPADYAAASGMLTFRPGEKAKAVPVTVVGDLLVEPNETFTVTLSSPVNASIAKATATGTIENDDTAVPVTAGSYKGLIDGNFLFFDVVDRYVTGFRTNYLREDCGSGLYVYGTLDFGSMRFPIAADATFRFVGDESGTIDNDPATFHFEVAGIFSGTTASGTLLGSSEFDYAGSHYTCSSGLKPWTASLQP